MWATSVLRRAAVYLTNAGLEESLTLLIYNEVLQCEQDLYSVRMEEVMRIVVLLVEI